MSAVAKALAMRDGTPRPAANPSRPLKLCFVSADYPSATHHGIGGIGAHAYALAHGIADLGHEVTVLTEADGKPDQYRDGPVHVRVLAPRSRRLWKLGRLMPVPWIRRSFAVWSALKGLHRERGFDLVRFPDGYGEGFRYSFTPLAPFAVHLHGPASLLQKWDGRRVPAARAAAERWIERQPASRASVLIAATKRFAETVAQEWDLDLGRVRVVRNPLDVDLFRPDPASPRGEGRVVLFAGHLQWLKGVTTLVAAMPGIVARHPDVVFELIGNDTRSAPDGTSMRRHLERALEAAGLRDRVSFLDPVPQSDLAGHYRRSSVFVLPSFHEVYGNVVLEAMACGRPCVVTSAIGAAELIVPGRTGAIVPPNHPAALADAIANLLALPRQALDEMGLSAREIVAKTCAVQAIAAQTIEVYREVLAGSARGTSGR